MTDHSKTLPVLADVTVDQILDYIDNRIAGSEVPWALRAPAVTPSPPPAVADPRPPTCAMVGLQQALAQSDAFALSGRRCFTPNADGHAAPTVWVSEATIWTELHDAMVAFRPRFADVGPDSRLADIANNRNGHFDIVSAVARSHFFATLGLTLRLRHLQQAQTMDEVVGVIADLLKSLGHKVDR